MTPSSSVIMTLEYQLMDECYRPSPNNERAIQRDLKWIEEGIMRRESGKPLFLVDGVRFERNVSIDGARAVGYIPQVLIDHSSTCKIHYTDGAIQGHYELAKPLEELTYDELLGHSREGSNTLIRFDMLQRLQELVAGR
jgi:hypothetical protein